MTTPPHHAVLVPGYWLGGWAWSDVEPLLHSAGIVAHSVTLPGLDGTTTQGLTLDDHVSAVVDLVDGLDGSVTLVGHSGGAPVVQSVADRRPQRISRVVYVDSGPMIDGIALRPDAVTDVALPAWDDLATEQLSIEGIDEATLAEFRRRAVPHPAGVASSPVRLINPARLNVPVTIICTSLPSAALGEMIAASQLPSELPSVADVDYIDLPTGHWPMFSRPADLARLIRDQILATR